MEGGGGAAGRLQLHKKKLCFQTLLILIDISEHLFAPSVSVTSRVSPAARLLLVAGQLSRRCEVVRWCSVGDVVPSECKQIFRTF